MQFQLFEQEGTFNNIDIFILTDFRNMEINSELLAHYKSLSIMFRSSINSLLTKLVNDKKIGKYITNLYREESQYLVNKMNINIDDLVFGAIYISICAIMKYVK